MATQQQRDAQKTWYQKNKERLVAERCEGRRERVKKFQEFKSSLKCSLCGEDAVECIEFHHRDPKEKDNNLADVAGMWSWTRLMTEVDKCVVVCSNCHRKIHSGRIRV